MPASGLSFSFGGPIGTATGGSNLYPRALFAGELEIDVAAIRERYGIDAPGIVRTLFGVGLTFVAGGSVAFWLIRAGNNSPIVHSLRANGFVVGGCLLLAGSWMLVSSLWLKRRLLQRLLGEHRWNGTERVLDVGCGRGLVAIEAAKRLPNGGQVIGIDLWQQQDLSGNSADAALQNAAAAGVGGRVVFETSDARDLPFADATFDVVASMTAIHIMPADEKQSRRLGE